MVKQIVNNECSKLPHRYAAVLVNFDRLNKIFLTLFTQHKKRFRICLYILIVKKYKLRIKKETKKFA